MEQVKDYIKAVRILLQDTMAPGYRYSDEEMKLALDMAFDEAYRIRPDMFLRVTVPTFATSNDDTTVPVPRGYKAAFVYYIAGHVQLRDQEETQDARATTFLNKFTAQLLATAS